MICKNNSIKELLPAYLRETLERPEQERVREHIASCEDCRTELLLLDAMTDETVLDPGEAFWAAMPGRVEREIRLRKENRISRLPGFLSGTFFPRWAWATSLTGIIAVAAWFLVHPAPVEMAGNSIPESAVLEEYMTADPLNLAELSSTELGAAGQWALNEFSTVEKQVSEEVSDTAERDILEGIYTLNQEELKRLSELLNRQEQGIRSRINKKKTQQDTIG